MTKSLLAGLFLFAMPAAFAQPTIGGTMTVNGTTTLTNPSSTNITPGTYYQYTGTFYPDANVLNSAYFIFEVWEAQQYSCKVTVLPGAGILQLADDEGNDTPYNSVGGSSTWANKKCSLNAGGSSIVPASGGGYNITVSFSFNSPYVGTKYVYLDAYDDAGLKSGWQNPNAEFLVTGPVAPPTIVSISPSSGVSSPGTYEEYEVTISAPSGAYSVVQTALMVLPAGGTWVWGYSPYSGNLCKPTVQITAHQHNLTDYTTSAPVIGNVGDGADPLTIPECSFYLAPGSIRYNDINTLVIGYTVSFSSTFGTPSGGSILQTHSWAQLNAASLVDNWDQPPSSYPTPAWTWNTLSSIPPIPSSLSDCLSGLSPWPNCTLAPNQDTNGNTIPYIVGSLINVPMSSTTITGTGSTKPVFQRSASYYGAGAAMMEVAGGVTGVTIQNIVFDGNRNAAFVYGSPGSYAQQRLSDNCNHDCEDLLIGKTATSGDTIQDNDFRNAPSYSIAVSDSGTTTHVQNITISNNTFENPFHSGVLVTGVGPLPGNCPTVPPFGHSPTISPNYHHCDDSYWDYNLCNASPTFVGVPTTITLSGNIFTGALGSAIALNESLNATVTSNQFYNNYYANSGDTSQTGGGSALFQSPCNANTSITGNTIDASGVGAGSVSGLELDGGLNATSLGLTVSNNRIQNIPGPGIYLAGAQNVMITDSAPPNPSGYVSNNSAASSVYFQSGGIWLNNFASFTTAPYNATSIRQTNNVTITGINATNNTGAAVIFSAESGVSPFLNINITTNCFSSPATGVMAYWASDTNSSITTINAMNNGLTGCN